MAPSIDFYSGILLPLVRPTLTAIGELTMIVSRNDLLTPLVSIGTETRGTLPLGTIQFQGQYSSDLSLGATFASISAVPDILLYLFAERQVVSGLKAGAFKG